MIKTVSTDNTLGETPGGGLFPDPLMDGQVIPMDKQETPGNRLTADSDAWSGGEIFSDETSEPLAGQQNQNSKDNAELSINEGIEAHFINNLTASPPREDLTSIDSARRRLEYTIAETKRVVDQETRALRNNLIENIKTYSDRKNLLVLELSRAMKCFAEACQTHQQYAQIEDGLEEKNSGDTLISMPEIKEAMEDLRESLDENMRLLQLHLSAVGEISDIIADQLIKDSSDGTYQSTACFDKKAHRG